MQSPISRAGRSPRRPLKESWPSSTRRATFAGAPALPRPVIALEVDPLGRYLIYGHSTGEIVRLDLFGGKEGRPAVVVSPRPTAASGKASGNGSMRSPNWLVPAVETEQQAETAVLTVLDDPPMIAVVTTPIACNSLTPRARRQGQGPDMAGVGRILRTAPGWLAAATDRQILLCDLRRNTFNRLDVSLVQLTHLAIKPDDFGLALVQERDRIGRLTPAGRWVWKHELRFPVEDLALGPQGFAAITTGGGQLQVFDPAGESTIGFTLDPTDPLLLIEAPEGSPPGVTWVSLARAPNGCEVTTFVGKWSGSVRLPGRMVTRSRLGRFAVIASADGRALSCDGSGTVHARESPRTTPTTCSAPLPTGSSFESPGTASI